MKKLLCSNCILFLLATLAPGVSANELLVAERNPESPSVSRYDAQTGEFLGVLIGAPSAESGLAFPSAMTLGPNGDLLIASDFNGDVLRYDAESGEFLGTFATGLNLPSGLLYNEEKDELLVSTLGNFDSELILQYRASTGELLATIGEGTGPSGRSSLVKGPDGNVYVSSFANGEFFLGAVLQFDGDSLAPLGNFAFNPLLGLAGASGLVFHEADEGYLLDVVGLFSNNVARFEVADGESGLVVGDSNVLIGDGLDFPSAIQPLGDGTMLVTNLGNNNEATGPLRPGSIGRYDVATGEFLGTYLEAGGDGMVSQPSALLLLDAGTVTPGCNYEVQGFRGGDLDGNGVVTFSDFLILSNNFGQEVDSYSDGDIDCDGSVDFPDFLILSANFGDSAETSSVPEPTSNWLLLIAGCCWLVTRRGCD